MFSNHFRPFNSSIGCIIAYTSWLYFSCSQHDIMTIHFSFKCLTLVDGIDKTKIWIKFYWKILWNFIVAAMRVCLCLTCRANQLNSPQTPKWVYRVVYCFHIHRFVCIQKGSNVLINTNAIVSKRGRDYSKSIGRVRKIDFVACDTIEWVPFEHSKVYRASAESTEERRLSGNANWLNSQQQ